MSIATTLVYIPLLLRLRTDHFFPAFLSSSFTRPSCLSLPQVNTLHLHHCLLSRTVDLRSRVGPPIPRLLILSHPFLFSCTFAANPKLSTRISSTRGHSLSHCQQPLLYVHLKVRRWCRDSLPRIVYINDVSSKLTSISAYLPHPSISPLPFVRPATTFRDNI